MKYPAENGILFYSALPEHDGWILSRTRELLARGVDAEYLAEAAESLGVATGLAALLTAVGGGEDISGKLHRSVEQERAVTARMRSLYEDIAALLESEGIPFVPLKGSDRRIVELSRRRSDPMQDVDILVRPADITSTGELLVWNGYLHLGSFSGAHMNFATDEDTPRFLEIHWDLVNRESPVQRRLYSPRIEKIWERCSILCGRLHLSPEDLLCYTAEHAAKEFFRRPKWTADMVCILDGLLKDMDPSLLREVIHEWGVSAVLGIVAHALASVLPERSYGALFAAGACKPGLLGRYVAERLFGYAQLYSMRPLCSLAFASTPLKMASVMVGIGERVLRGRRRN